ncbi:hypothetical protein VQ042_09255 [Aurantimonas sp. A2-1-M11]|uniref:hypothetical protein n=1 Tax=Aurantimonas sp. A2-1-M11 TaxID=3113712 RepID=UPI002F924971
MPARSPVLFRRLHDPIFRVDGQRFPRHDDGFHVARRPGLPFPSQLRADGVLSLRHVAIKLANDSAAALMIVHGMPTPHDPDIRREMAATILKDAIADAPSS